MNARFTGWTVAGIILAVLLGAIHAAGSIILEQPARYLPKSWKF